jgi:hypothetical protein
MLKVNEYKKATMVITGEIIEYPEHSAVSKTIVNRSTGNIRVLWSGSGEGLIEKTFPFDSYRQIMERSAELFISTISGCLKAGQSFVIPAHAPNFARLN